MKWLWYMQLQQFSECSAQLNFEASTQQRSFIFYRLKSPKAIVLWLKKSTRRNSSTHGPPSSHRGPLCPRLQHPSPLSASEPLGSGFWPQRCRHGGWGVHTWGQGAPDFGGCSAASLASPRSILPLPQLWKITAVFIPCQMSHKGKTAPNWEPVT